MTRDEIVRMAREADTIDFRDNDSDPHVAQFIDFGYPDFAVFPASDLGHVILVKTGLCCCFFVRVQLPLNRIYLWGV